MKSNYEDRVHNQGAVHQTSLHDDGRIPRQGDERTRTRRLADVRRGSKSRHHLELLASAQGRVKQQSSTPSSWTSESRGLELRSAKEKRDEILQKPPDLETRHSCPALPAISSSLEDHHDLHDSNKESCKNRLSASHDLSSKDKQLNKFERINQDLPKEVQFLARAKSLDFIANSRHPPLKAVSLLPKDKPENQLFNRTSSTLQNEYEFTAVSNMKVNTKPKLHLENIGIAQDIEDPSSTKHAGVSVRSPVISTRDRYSVLLNGGTLTKNAPYVDKIRKDTPEQNITSTKNESVRQLNDSKSCQRKTTIDNSSGRDHGRPPQKSSSPHRKLDSVPSSSRRRGRHLRSHKELFAFQQDLLLPRYRKLAGINGNDGNETMITENDESERPSGEEHQGDEGNTRRSDAREVFEKVRLIIKGPEKVETVPKPTEHKVRQMMPIYLKSGLPCGYVDSSSKCDAWLDSNDFEDL